MNPVRPVMPPVVWATTNQSSLDNVLPCTLGWPHLLKYGEDGLAEVALKIGSDGSGKRGDEKVKSDRPSPSRFAEEPLPSSPPP